MSKKGAGKDFLKGDLIETFIDTAYVKPMTSMLYRYLNLNHVQIKTIYHGVCTKVHDILHTTYE